MRSYFIEISEDGIVALDEVIVELGDVKQARTKAIEILSGMIGQVDENQDRQEVIAIVRDDRRDIVYRAVITLDSRYSVAAGSSAEADRAEIIIR